MARGGINKKELERMTRDIQRELDKNPVYVPVRTNIPDTPGAVPAPIVNHNYGPVFHSTVDGAQFVWNSSGSVHQEQGTTTEAVTSGFEQIAHALSEVLHGLPSAALNEDDEAAAKEGAEAALAEVTKEEPDRSVVRRAVVALRGLLSPVALGIAEGAGDGAHEWAQHAIASLGAPF